MEQYDRSLLHQRDLLLISPEEDEEMKFETKTGGMLCFVNG